MTYQLIHVLLILNKKDNTYIQNYAYQEQRKWSINNKLLYRGIMQCLLTLLTFLWPWLYVPPSSHFSAVRQPPFFHLPSLLHPHMQHDLSSPRGALVSTDLLLHPPFSHLPMFALLFPMYYHATLTLLLSYPCNPHPPSIYSAEFSPLTYTYTLTDFNAWWGHFSSCSLLARYTKKNTGISHSKTFLV